MDWFQTLTGFKEDGYDNTRQKLRVDGERLHSTVNGKHWAIGRLETPSLAELRTQASKAVRPSSGTLKVTAMASDAKELHTRASSCGALFQVASQFNLLEMTNYDITPEMGVTRYERDFTQGPACAVAAGAATLYRNYFAPVGQEGLQQGQTKHQQINTLADLSAALGTGLIEMRNGYALCSDAQLQQINRQLTALDEAERHALRDTLRIGLHWDVEVTTPGEGQGQLVSQAFCSALPVAYNRGLSASWEPLSRLVLEAAYEATLWAAVINAQRGASKDVYLTQLGGGAFGNDSDWIMQAMTRALDCVAQHDLNVYLVSYRDIPRAFHDLEHRYAAKQTTGSVA